MTNKAVLISIRPKWCELIASGKKTVEVRKTAPKIPTPFKCYIYCTKFQPGDPDSIINLKGRTSFFMPKGGAVIGEFVCDGIQKLTYRDDGEHQYYQWLDAPVWAFFLEHSACLTHEQIKNYLLGKMGYGWHISDLVIYDVPKQLSDFRLYNTSAVIEDGLPMPTHEIRRPPQSWCYVEVME